MALLLFAAFVVVVVALAVASSRTGTAGQGCCAPADPADDLRMRSAEDDPGRDRRG